MFVGIYFIFSALSSLHLINGAAAEDDYSFVIPEECKNQNYCTIRPQNSAEELDNKEQFPEPTYVQLANRRSDPDLRDGCETTVEYKLLTHVKSIDGQWHAVVEEHDKNFLQTVRIERCKNTGGKCFEDFMRIPPGVKTFCNQKLTPWQFVVHAGHGTVKRVKVKLPTCCVCRYKKIEV
ncbi:hypothetical protein PYW07_001488 [Mythimna separata]|uniref:Spaetzle domain-containing protein n=1 Tax=Mythimna separata TaxID=271217 RepID=A0AAD8DX09_MYTSE|nr:hypothetical protein PYW07_001488 [Mythimna separata]